MSDPFTLLGLPRRPWLDGAAVRAAFQERARLSHPDAPGGNAEAFAALNAACVALADPASRLQALGAEAAGMPADREFGFRVGAAFRQADEMLARLGAARNALERALLAREAAAVRVSLAQLDLPGRFAAAEERLRALDAKWPEADPADLAALATEFRFLQRWRTQLREREVALSIADPAG